jgi:hypothetical protein
MGQSGDRGVDQGPATEAGGGSARVSKSSLPAPAEHLGRSGDRHPANTVDKCRYPGLPCDRLCMECRGSFDIVDRETGRRVGDVDDQTAMNRMRREFGDPEDWS